MLPGNLFEHRSVIRSPPTFDDWKRSKRKNSVGRLQQSPVKRSRCGAPRMLVSQGSQEFDQKSFWCLKSKHT
ncbi:hypothetical protein CBM2592_P50005 [Cupriavidus taiwanensis]|uniref:Uncharacterized protein n=3 Tax=Cupriavidus TaxID=106589 RepID=A0A375DBY8_9BURK|nr:hypothetical protein pRALTA_0067 [Cupriavidus taiwanensis LMG 19424]SOY76723.1 hypothetical protein CBM2592_P50005 [Cupriavidus taiwanensis]SPD62065.1 conserved protein of unknown function [Cupriavidus neocaledonicus]SOY76729.1 hypothetical protein CBM2585_P40005 [Cupriavidus taiwanensis]SOY78139.1 hypothetical protein CBM2586_P50005 [Cupriavidus taiwanensis]